jgi:hypothetical protein
MLIAGEMIDIAKYTVLNNLAIAKNNQAVMSFLNFAISELYSRFNMSIKVETVETNPDLSLYELRNENVNMLLSIYDHNGKELNKTDVLNGEHDYKIINYKSFLLNRPKKRFLFAIYKATPPKVTSREDKIDLPDAFTDPLLLYIGYLTHNSINLDGMRESNTYSTRFENACLALDMQGYKVSLNNEHISLMLKGYR